MSSGPPCVHLFGFSGAKWRKYVFKGCHRSTTNRVKRGSWSHHLLLWELLGAHGTHRISAIPILACFSVDFGTSLHDWRVFQAIIMLRRPTSCVFVCLQFHELHHVPERVSLALQGVALRDEMVNQRSSKKWHKKYFSEFYPLATRWYGVSLL